MSQKSKERQRLKEVIRLANARPPRARQLRRVVLLISIAVVAVGGVVAWFHFRPATRGTTGMVAAGPSPFKQPRTFKELLTLPSEQIDRCDVGLMNLLCAEGLPGAEGLNVDECLKKLDGWADRVRSETQRHAYRFKEHPGEFRNSLGYFQMMTLGTVLAEDLGIRYNPDLALPQMDGKIPTLGDGADSKDAFIHGLLDGKHLGTCASMPVLLVAIGRRLGYPVNLAGTKYHLYVRYEEENGEHFNFEPTVTDLFLTPTDEDYQNGKFQTTSEEAKSRGWLRPMSNADALAQFLTHRAVCLGDAKRYEEAKQMVLLSAKYATDTPAKRKSTDYYLQAIKDAPLGDQFDALWAEIEKLDVPAGPRSVYFENRKARVHYFMSGNTDWPAVERAGQDLKNELAGYARSIGFCSPRAGNLGHSWACADSDLYWVALHRNPMNPGFGKLPGCIGYGSCIDVAVVDMGAFDLRKGREKDRR